MVIPVGDDGRILMVRQYRYLSDSICVEFPCGGVLAGLSPEQNALKELREETGFTSRELIPIGWFTPFTGASDERCSVFIARQLELSPLEPDETEEIELVLTTFDDIENMVQTNELNDGLSLAAWSLSKLKLLEIVKGAVSLVK